MDTESQIIGDVVGGLDNAVGINVAVRSRHSSISVSCFVFLRVDVGVSVLDVAEFILSLELAGGVQRSCSNDGSGGGVDSDDGSGSGGSLVGNRSGSIGQGSAKAVGSGDDLGLGSGHTGSKKNLQKRKEKIRETLHSSTLTKYLIL